MKFSRCNFISIVVLYIVSASALSTNAQESSLSLDEAILIAQKKSFEYKAAFNRYQSSVWNYENYKSSFLPTIFLDGTTPNYSRSINRITLPTGEDTFVSQHQSFSNLNLNARQNISATGGVLSLGSSLSRIDVFGSNRQVRYSMVPISLSYFQNTIGYNVFKWTRKIEPVRFESSEREFAVSMQQIGSQTISNFFSLISTQIQRTLSKQNLANADTLSRIAKDRFALGSVSQSELLQLRLNILNAQNKVREDSLNYLLARKQFSKYLLLDETDWVLEIPDKISFFNISFDDALIQARNNSQTTTDNKIKFMEAERNLVQKKAENGLKFNIQANFGLSNASGNIPMLFDHLLNQQNLVLGFSAPLVDWKFAKTQRLRAEANLAMVKNEIEQGELLLEQQVALYVSKWNAHQKNISSAIEIKDIAQRNYDLEVARYRAGNITLNDLISAQNQKDNAINNYIQSIRIYWELYYSVRKITLYDFFREKRIIAF